MSHKTPSTSSNSSDWEDAQLSERGEWASDHYSDSDSDGWTCLDSDVTSTTSTDDEAEAEAEAAVQEKIEAMMNTGAAKAHVKEPEAETERAAEEGTSAIKSEAPESADDVTLSSSAPAQERAPSPSPAPAPAPAPTPAPSTPPSPSPATSSEPTQALKPLSLQARISLATHHYTHLARLEASLASDLAAVPPAQPPTPPPPVSFLAMLERYRAYDEAYLAAAEADRLHRQNLNLPPKGLWLGFATGLPAGGPAPQHVGSAPGRDRLLACVGGEESGGEEDQGEV